MRTDQKKLTKKTPQACLLLILQMLLIVSLMSTSVNGQSPEIFPNTQDDKSLSIQQVSFSKNDPLEGENVNINAEIRNNKSIPVSNITITFMIDERILGNMSNISLGENSSKVIGMNWTAEKYSHVISVLISVNGQPLKETMVTSEIYIKPLPVGNLMTPAILIASLFIIILLIIVGLSIVEYINGNRQLHLKKASK